MEAVSCESSHLYREGLPMGPGSKPKGGSSSSDLPLRLAGVRDLLGGCLPCRLSILEFSAEWECEDEDVRRSFPVTLELLWDEAAFDEGR